MTHTMHTARAMHTGAIARVLAGMAGVAHENPTKSLLFEELVERLGGHEAARTAVTQARREEMSAEWRRMPLAAKKAVPQAEYVEARLGAVAREAEGANRRPADPLVVWVSISPTGARGFHHESAARADAAARNGVALPLEVAS